jgi:hydrogenase maturation protease
MSDAGADCNEKVIVLGIGNVLLRDEGFGVRVLEYLVANYDFPDDVELIDGGTLGVELIRYVVGAGMLLIIDSINGGAKPGTLFRLADEQVAAHFAEKISVHEVGIQDILTMLQLTGRTIPRLVVIGAQPYDLEPGVGLSEPMQKLLPQFASGAISELKIWGVHPTRKIKTREIDYSVVAEAKFDRN